MLAYVYDIIIYQEIPTLKSSTEKLTKSCKKLSLAINEDKTKYLVMNKPRNKSDLRVAPYSFG